MSAYRDTAQASEIAAKRLGIAAMCAGMVMLPVGDALSKLLTAVAPPFDVTVWRTVAQALCFLPLAFVLRRKLHGPLFTPAAALSGALMAAVMFFLVTAFETMPIATAIAIFFIEPLLLTLLAGPFLGEAPGPRRYAAVAVGLVGALIVIRPNFEVFGPVVLMPVLAALAYALNMIVLRRATRGRSVLTFQLGATFWAAGLVLLVLGAGALLGRAPAPILDLPAWAVGAVLAAGALAVATFLLIALAFSRAEASLLAPFQYLEIVGATAVGYIVFGDFPDALTWAGTAVILGAGLYVLHRERRRDRAVSSRSRRPGTGSSDPD